MSSTYNNNLGKLVAIGAFSLLPACQPNVREVITETNISKTYIPKTELAKTTETSGITSKTFSPWPAVYDSTTNSFIERKDGIDESFLNKINGPIYKNSHYADYFRTVDSSENIGTWRPLDQHEAGISQLYTLMTAIDNFKIISEVDNAQRGSLADSLLPLKNVLTSLDSIYVKNLKPREKLRRMYELLTNHIKTGEKTSGSLGVAELARGRLGDCNDVGPAFYSLFTYYGFDTSMRFGKTLNEQGESEGLHTWIGVKLPEGYIDLDPGWYSTFVPLEDRCTEIEYDGVNSRYVITKK